MNQGSNEGEVMRLSTPKVKARNVATVVVDRDDGPHVFRTSHTFMVEVDSGRYTLSLDGDQIDALSREGATALRDALTAVLDWTPGDCDE